MNDRSLTTSYAFLKSVLDSVTEHIVVIDKTGTIQFVNRAWINFGQVNACTVLSDWHGMNYLNACDAAAAMGEEYGKQAADGIRKVITGVLDNFYFEYPCNSPDEKRWFMMRITSFEQQGTPFYVISHQNITERKLAEEDVRNLARIDGLTLLANRRHFDEFLSNEWHRCARQNLPITLALIDIDHFKLLNDTYGHQYGDDCLRQIAATLKDFGKRPSDLCARYGGEEFAIIYGNTSLDQARSLMNRLLESLRALSIPNKEAPTQPFVTASIGLISMTPRLRNNEKDLIKAADKLLYAAKLNGRNRIVSSRET